MTDAGTEPSEAQRLEQVWAGEFGDSYTERNRNAYDARGAFWSRLLAQFPVESVLEVGCNGGGNLVHIQRDGSGPVCVGVDINATSLEELRDRIPRCVGVLTPARNLPFVSSTFDLVMTVGVLIHQPAESLGAVMSEIVRCSRRYVLSAEYEAPVDTPVEYRGVPGSLFKRPYGLLYSKGFPELVKVAEGVLGAEEGFDDVAWTLFEKS